MADEIGICPSIVTIGAKRDGIYRNEKDRGVWDSNHKGIETMDSGTGLTILGTAVGSARLVEKVLGPTASYLGDGLRDWVEQRVENVSNIFKSADRKIDDQNDPSLAVPPAILKAVLDDGSFRDDQLSAEYFGGVLASSRTQDGADDRGLPYLQTVTRLSSFQLRAHFIFYMVFKQLYDGADGNLSRISHVSRMGVFIPTDVLYLALDLVGRDETERFSILTHITNGLAKEDLIHRSRFFGSSSELRKLLNTDLSSGGLFFKPTVFGFELLLWAQGKGHSSVKDFLDPTLSLELPNKVTINLGSQKVPHTPDPDDGVVRAAWS